MRRVLLAVQKRTTRRGRGEKAPVGGGWATA